MCCAARLQRYDLEQDEARGKFDLDRDEAQRRFMAALHGIKLKDDTPKTGKRQPRSEPAQPMTARDIMRNYGK